MNFKLLLNRYSGFLEKLFFSSKKKSVVGIDIGTSCIKAVEVGLWHDSFEIRNWAIESIEGTDARSAMQRLLARMNIKDQVPVTSVSGKGILTRYVEMPRMPIEDLRKSLTYEIDKYFSLDPQTIYTDCYTINSVGSKNKFPVLLVAVKKDLVDERIKFFKDIGMQLAWVTTNFIATANAFENSIKGKKTVPVRAILDIGGAVSNLIILDENNFPSFTRDFFVGGQEMTKQIAEKLGVSLEQASHLKKNPGDRFDEVFTACELSVDSLTSELRLSLDYFMTEKNSSVTEIFLVGGGSLLKGIKDAFEKSLNIPIKIWNPLAELRLGASVLATDINAHSSQLGVAIGLAMTKI